MQSFHYLSIMLKTFLLSSFTILSVAASAQCKPGNLYIDTSAAQSYDWPTINFGFPPAQEEETGAIAAYTAIRIDTIPAVAFQKYQKNHQPKICRDTSMITRTDTSFTIRTAGFTQTFPSNIVCECTSSDYIGLIPQLNLLMVSSTDMANEIADLQLLDRRTGKPFWVPSSTDQGPQGILLSPKNTILLTYCSSYYEQDNCSIYLMKVNTNPKKKSFTLDNYLVINFNRLNIESLVWIDEKSFAMSVTEQLSPEDNDAQKIRYCLKITM